MQYALVCPCVVTNAVKLGDGLIFIFILSLILGKCSLVTSPLVVAPPMLLPFRYGLFPIFVALFRFLVFCYSIFRCFWWPPWRVYLLVHFRCVLRGPLSM